MKICEDLQRNHKHGRYHNNTNAIKTVQSGKIDPRKLITHRFKLDQIMEAYDPFENAGKKKTLKVIMTNENE